MMRVILSIEPVRFPLTGIGRYTYELAKALQDHTDSCELRLFGATRFIEQLPQAQEHDDGRMRLKGMVQKSRLASEAYRRLMPLLKQHALRDFKDYLYHGPNFYLPPFRGLRVATFHDLSPFKWTECAAPQRVRFMQQELNVARKRADAFITDSQHGRLELAEYFDIDLQKIHAIPLASSAEFHPRSMEQTRATLDRHGLNHDGYSLYVGTIEPRKNLLSLLAAYERLPLPMRQRWPLVLSGYRGWRSEAIHAAIARAQNQGWARYLGFTPAADLPALYAGARLFCFPSLYEGFGLPVLEAMSSGTPVLCSNSSSLPEVAGDAALLNEPQDIEGMTQNLLRGLEDSAWRAEARLKGLRNAQGYSWQRCAEQTLHAYQQVIESR